LQQRLIFAAMALLRGHVVQAAVAVHLVVQGYETLDPFPRLRRVCLLVCRAPGPKRETPPKRGFPTRTKRVRYAATRTLRFNAPSTPSALPKSQTAPGTGTTAAEPCAASIQLANELTRIEPDKSP